MILTQLTTASLAVFAIGIFTSISISAMGHLLLAIAGVYVIFLNIKNGEKLSLSISAWSLVALCATIGLSVIFNLDIEANPWGNLSKVKYFIIPLLGIFALRSVAPWTDRRIRLLLILLLAATTLASLSGIIAYYTGFNPLKMKPGCHPERACGMYGMYMTYGYGISLFQVLLTGAIIYRREFSRWIPTWMLILAWVINGWGLYLSMARGGWIGFAATVPLFFFKQNKKRMVILGAVLLAVAAILVGTVPSVKQFLANRGGSDAQRVSFAKAAIAAFKERPLLGYGYRNFEPHSAEIKKRYGIEHDFYTGHAHNNILEHLASTGLLGALAYLAFVLSWLWEAYRREDLMAQLTMPFVFSFALAGLFQYTFGDGENLFLIMGIYLLFQGALPLNVNKATNPTGQKETPGSGKWRHQ